MSQFYDRRTHADAIRKQKRLNQSRRLRRQIFIMLLSVVAGALCLPYVLMTKQDLWAAGVYAYARASLWIAEGFSNNPSIQVTYFGFKYTLSALGVVSEPAYWRPVQYALVDMGIGSILGLGVWLASVTLLANTLAQHSERALQDRIVTGTQVTTEKRLAELTREEAMPQALAIGKVPIPSRLETRHIAMIGTTGSGKTTALRQLLDGIETRGDAAFVYDTSGDFIAHYFQPERGDIILNPFDARCAFWSPFAEIAHPADADRIANQLIAETGQHERDVWLETSRILVANMIRALWREDKGTLSELLNALQVRTKDDLKIWLADSSSARTFAEDADRATGSVLFMLAKAANLIQFLRCEDNESAPFGFRDFVQGLDKRTGARPWIFVPRKEDYFEASKPLLACWLECAASAVLGLAPSPDRRIWFVLDELADLPRVDNLARLLPEGRKFGAAVVLTFQALGQMRHRYGQQLAESMLGCCNTKLFLQSVDSETRQWASQNIGECEVEIQTMTEALAEGDDKPRTTLSKMRTMRPAVLESQLRLPKFEGYLLLPDGMPVARIKLTSDQISRRGVARHPGFVSGNPTTTLWERTVREKPTSALTMQSIISDGPV